jgi:hypothetical protein
MAVMIQVTLQLRPNQIGYRPEARFWLDAQSESGLGSEIELPLSQDGNHEWSGTVALDDSTPQFLYRMGLLAHEGAIWSLSIRNRTLGYTLLSDSDELGSAKAWLTGVCPLSHLHAQAITVGAKRSSKGSALPRSRNRRPYLLLLDR